VADVGVEVELRGLDGFVTEDLLEDMKGNAGVGQPSRAGVSEPVSAEVREPDVGDEGIPLGRTSN
jgi:hypothetical protein